jgi:hypothetical protein
VESQSRKLQTEDDAEKSEREFFKKAIPDDLQQRLDAYKAEAAEAVKERDKDRWLAVAMGGFATAAGSSPYALRNFAEGLGLTTKEMMSINKDFRKLEQERNKFMREEQRLNRAEKIGVEKDIRAARNRARDRRDSFDQYQTQVELNLAKIAQDKWKTLEENRSRERVAGMAYGDRSDKNALTKRIEVLALKNARGTATPEEKKELTSLVNQLGEISGAKKTKPPSVDPDKLLPVVAQIQAYRKRGDPMSLYMAGMLEESAGIKVPDAAVAGGSQGAGSSSPIKFLGYEKAGAQ